MTKHESFLPMEETAGAYNDFLDRLSELTGTPVMNIMEGIPGLIGVTVITSPDGRVSMFSNAHSELANAILKWHLDYNDNVATGSVPGVN